MVNGERRYLAEAQQLYVEAQRANLNYGCVEVCLRALGGNPTHLVELLAGNPTQKSPLSDVIERKGLQLNWIVSVNHGVTPEAVASLLEGNISFSQSRPNGKLAGYLGVEMYPSHDQEDHVIAILPRHHLPRDWRRQLKKKKAYLVVDTASGGFLQANTALLAKHINEVVGQGGGFGIIQLWR